MSTLTMTSPPPDACQPTPSPSADREQLILAYAPTIKYLAQRIAARLPPPISVEDLIHVGVIGLIDAIEKFDPSRDILFKTYAEFRIRGAMLDELRALDWVPRSVRQKEGALARAYRELERTLGRPAQDEEVAAFLGIELETLDEWYHQVKGVALVSLDTPGLRTKEGEALNLLEVLIPEHAASPAQFVQTQRLKALVAEAIDALPYKEKVIISLYYYEELTMKEIGKVLDITESRVSQLHTKTILHLRNTLQGLFQALI
jgi:RNA polymerase sigma factor for flagellar operon FliA